MPKQNKDRQTSEELFYEVQDLIDWKQEKGNQEFLVWWKGYSKGESTWEPKEHFQSYSSEWAEQMEICRQIALQRENDNKKTKQIKAIQRKKVDESVKRKKEEERAKRMQKSIELLANLLVKESHRYNTQNQMKREEQFFSQEVERMDEEHKESSNFLFQRIPLQVYQLSFDNKVQKLSNISKNVFLSKSAFHPSQDMVGFKTVDDLNKEKINLEKQIDNESNIQLENFSYQQNLQSKQYCDNPQIENTNNNKKNIFKKFQLSQIIDTFSHKNQTLYELKLINSVVEEIIMYEDSVKKLWPEQLAQYLRRKQKVSNQQ